MKDYILHLLSRAGSNSAIAKTIHDVLEKRLVFLIYVQKKTLDFFSFHIPPNDPHYSILREYESKGEQTIEGSDIHFKVTPDDRLCIWLATATAA